MNFGDVSGLSGLLFPDPFGLVATVYTFLHGFPGERVYSDTVAGLLRLGDPAVDAI